MKSAKTVKAPTAPKRPWKPVPKSRPFVDGVLHQAQTAARVAQQTVAAALEEAVVRTLWDLHNRNPGRGVSFLAAEGHWDFRVGCAGPGSRIVDPRVCQALNSCLKEFGASAVPHVRLTIVNGQLNRYESR